MRERRGGGGGMGPDKSICFSAGLSPFLHFCEGGGFLFVFCLFGRFLLLFLVCFLSRGGGGGVLIVVVVEAVIVFVMVG